MAVHGKQKENKEFTREFYTGFTAVTVKAVNPTREELNEMIGREADPEDKELTYVGKTDDGTDKVRMTFWLYDEKNEKYFPYSFTLTNRERRNKDNTKVQMINSTCVTYWCPLKVNAEGQVTDEADESLLPEWFTHFTDKEKQKTGTKQWRRAMSGEEELGTLLRSWLGRLNFSDPDTEVMVDVPKLIKGNYKELRALIDGEFDTPFTALTGVRTDEADATKKYQQVYGKSFLPQGFMKFINNGMKFPSDYARKTWERFEKEVLGDYGFSGFTKLEPLAPYDPQEDVSGSGQTKASITAESSEY